MTVYRKAALLLLSASGIFFASSLPAQGDASNPTSNNREITVVPAPGEVVIDGETSDWDLSASIWSYNDPTLVGKYSVWTSLMWDEKGIYLLGRFHDISSLQNGTRGKDFMQSWRSDAMQTRVIFEDGEEDEHQMHINLFYSTPEETPYMIVKHGGFKSKPPYDGTGPDRPDQLEKYGTTMEKFGGEIAFQEWEDGEGYNMEAFWPWSYLRTSGEPLEPGEEFKFGIEAMWGNSDGTKLSHRLADNLKNDQVNRIFFFRARDGWGRAVISEEGDLAIARAQEELQAERLKMFVNYETEGSIPIQYTLEKEGEVTIAIDNANGERVRNLFGQFPREAGENTDFWDGLDDQGNPVAPGEYTVTIVDHEPFELQILNSVYNAATPPWPTDTGHKIWGSNHGYPTTAATRGDTILLGFTGTEGSSGLMNITSDGLIQWNDSYELIDVTLDEKYAYAFSRDSWIKQTVIRRYNLETGDLVLFENDDKSPNSVLPIENEEVKDGTIAVIGDQVFVFIRGNSFYRLDASTGALEGQFEAPGLIAVDDRNGVLRGLFEDGSIRVLNEEGKPTEVVFQSDKLQDPVRFALSQDGSTYAISDQATNQVFLFNPQGDLVQTIGSPYEAKDGKRPAGEFVQEDLIRPLGLDFDSDGNLWLAEASGTCRRITHWTPDGELIAQFWGAADYGAMAGFPLTYDSNRFIAHGVEFQLDPDPDIENRPTQEQPLFFHPALAKTRGLVYEFNGYEYAVSVPGYNKQRYVIIAKRNDEGVFTPVVRIDYPSGRGDDREPGKIWTDLNENGEQDPGEVVEGFEARLHYWSNGWMRPDMTFITPDQQVFRVQEFTEGGVPVYDLNQPEIPENHFDPDFRSSRSGTIVMDLEGNLSDGINYSTVDGKTGSYPNPYGRHDAPAASRGLLIAPFRTNGVVEDVPEVGSVTAIGGDRGEWFLMTMDGLFLSNLFQDIKGDVTLDETYLGGESFGGFIWRDENDRILLQPGGSSYRIMELLGSETIEKEVKTISVNEEQIFKGIALAEKRAAEGNVEPEALQIAKVRKLPQSAPEADTRSNDSLITGAETFRVQEAGDPTRWFRAALARDNQDLAVVWQVNDTNPWKNGEKQFTHAFIGGDAVDLQLDVPGRGPIRLLVAPIDGKNTVIYWQKEAENPQNPMTYVVSNNPGNAQEFDVVKILKDAKVSVNQGMLGYSVLLRVPLKDLGIDPSLDQDLTGIVGVIFSDPSGTNRVSRLYWHDKNTGMVSDVPSEAKLNPKNWGVIGIAD
ncbi:FlgD immunoglobulin-like domain containing protein [Puniceicoccus vermicola]|uniref:FlgD/Vpr Ig-like domain-containing protein n=1 Tax=Puniceicoccus vermicola TaxID=388746 RepID=A0A7X1E487_9BACT|nr:FlgD immunoglobulin-like domain containing protein [Puniceicoccus vermicola]MBC2601728.1 hypothetical protein [Puniceicoccus vermicola]